MRRVTITLIIHYLSNMPKRIYRKGSHSVYSIALHTYFVTAYRRKCLSAQMVDRADEVAASILVVKDCILLECNGEPDHIHLLVDMHPSVAPSKVFGSIKSAISRTLRKEFEPELRPYFKNWNKGLWGDQSYYASSGGDPIEVLEKYIQSHSRGSGNI